MKINIDKLQITLFKIYLLLLPMTLFHPLKITKSLGAIGDSSAFIIHVLGMLIIVLNIFRNKRFETSKLMTYIGVMITILNLSSIFMAVILNYKLGVLYGETTYNAIIGDIVYYTQIIFIFYYNYYLGNKIDKSYISKVFFVITICTLFIGYLQIFIINGMSFLTPIHKILETMGLAYDVNDMARVGKLYLIGGEASTVANTVGFIVAPYLLANIIISDKKIYRILLLMYIPIIYFSKSSTVYMAIAIQIFIFIIITIDRIKIRINKKASLTIVGIGIVLVGGIFANWDKGGSSKFAEEIKYYLIEKVSDSKNLSTVFRESTVKNNIEVFKKYPILGIGNGLQGYYYEENLESYAYNSEEVREVLKGDSGIPSGGSFLTAYISGYGMIGIALLMVFIYRGIKSMIKGNELYYIYVFGGINFLVLSTMALGIAGNYLAIFIISIPLFNTKENGEINNE